MAYINKMSGEEKRNVTTELVFNIFSDFKQRLDNKYKKMVDMEGRNIIDFASIAVKLTNITIDLINQNNLLRGEQYGND